MPKGKRTPEASADDLALFASFVRSEERKAKDEKRRARDERRQAGEHQRLVQAKDAAAAEVKRLRSSDRATAEQRAAADDAYRVALAAVVAHETGAAPEWAPPPAADSPDSPDAPSAGEEPAPPGDADDAPAASEEATDEPAADGTAD
ncbi:MAG: hypothetical protein KDA97_08345 [Acidimicrobiales bacterium]|nr:hypothetical protein [Acidimicrobiales bacterium]